MRHIKEDFGTVWCEDVWRFGVRYYKGQYHQHQITLPTFQGTRYIIGQNISITTAAMKTNIFGNVCMQTQSQTPAVNMVKDSFFLDIQFPGLSLNEDKVFHTLSGQGGQGNLSYMDGGTNSTAIEPARKGLPVVNYVHFPEGMNQTLHTHPSQRIGLVLTGTGSIELNGGNFFPLHQGSAFWMDRNELHNFMCNSGDDVTLFVFAPDSGMGPTDEVNPLKARTYIGQTR